jgi:hypothetical protein
MKIKWHFTKDNPPTEKDMPFLTYEPNHKHFEIWNDSDWFFELDDEERLERQVWRKLISPIIEE